ncbi:MAG: Mor transcription activator family protein [Mizugakiibacter sp.]|uniref:Mor transcription activator family protein n=1 Tax=Mizugakiibacter sp. TaxID=1972610 RepID=UPI00320D3F08
MTDDHEIDSATWWRDELIIGIQLATGMKGEFAERFADSLLCVMRKRNGGREIYIPVIDNTIRKDAQQRYASIKKEFNGRNMRELMRKYKVSKRTIYRACKK